MSYLKKISKIHLLLLPSILFYKIKSECYLCELYLKMVERFCIRFKCNYHNEDSKAKNFLTSCQRIEFGDIKKPGIKDDKIKFIVTGYTCSGVSWILAFLSELGIMSLNILGYKDYEHLQQNIHKKDDGKAYFNTNGIYTYAYKVCSNLFGKSESEINLDLIYDWRGHAPVSIEESTIYKTIVVVRDPRDVAISRYLYDVESGDCPKLNAQNHEFFDKHACGTIGGWSSFYEGCLPLYKRNLKFIKFEDRLADPYKTANEILQFLNLDFSEDLIRKAVECASFENGQKTEQYIMNNKKHLIVDHRPYFVSGKSLKYLDTEYKVFDDIFKKLYNYGKVTMEKFGYKY